MSGPSETASKRRLLEKVVIVTGAGRGIGRAEALLAAAQGAKVVVNDLGGGPMGGGADPGVAQKVVEEIRAAGGEAVASKESVATMEGGRRIVEAAIENFGRLDILINNAGITRPRIIFNMSEEDWDVAMAVNLKGHFTTIRFAAPIFREQRSGVIVNTSSASGLGHLGQAAYSASKEGIIGLTRTVARDLGRYGVRCNAIRPTATTRLTDERAVEGMLRTQETLGLPAIGDRWIERDSFKEATPERVAALAVWLCTDAAGNVNGRTLEVGGEEIGLYSEPQIMRSVHQPGGWDLDALDRFAAKALVGDLRNEFFTREK
jgi:3-oxoacyl-[acyl-carrier protein] reductase